MSRIQNPEPDTWMTTSMTSAPLKTIKVWESGESVYDSQMSLRLQMSRTNLRTPLTTTETKMSLAQPPPRTFINNPRAPSGVWAAPEGAEGREGRPVGCVSRWARVLALWNRVWRGRVGGGGIPGRNCDAPRPGRGIRGQSGPVPARRATLGQNRIVGGRFWARVKLALG